MQQCHKKGGEREDERKGSSEGRNEEQRHKEKIRGGRKGENKRKKVYLLYNHVQCKSM